MKVALVYRKKNPLFFSIERVFSRIEKELKEKERKERISLRKILAPRIGVSLMNVLAVSSFFKKEKSDVYHITGDIHYVVFGFPRRKVLLTIHDCVFLYQTKGLKRLILKKILLDWPVRWSAMITTISEASRQDILKYTGCSPDKVVVIPNPVNEQIQYQPRDFFIVQPIILFVGTTPNKNLSRTIAALENIPCQLHIVGRIPDAEIRLLAEHRISFRQSLHLTDAELAASYCEADLVLFPSTFEGFGLPILEGQKAGRPVVTSDLIPMKEVAGDGACLVDPYSIDSIRTAVLNVIGDPYFRDRLVQSGFSNIKRFDVNTIAGQYLACYQRLNKTLS